MDSCESLKIIELNSNNVMAERIGYMVDKAQGFKGHIAQPLAFRVHPLDRNYSTTCDLDKEDRYLYISSFVHKVLKPINQ